MSDGAELRPVTPVGLAVQALEEGRPDRAHDLLAPLDAYVGACSSPESSDLARLAGRSDAHRWGPDDTLEPEMLSGHVEGRFLAMLVKIAGARRVLDVGTFTGYSALAMAEALNDEGVEGAQVVTCELDDRVADMAARAFAESVAGALIRLERGPAPSTLAALADAGERFDVAFLDADKPGYIEVFETILDRGLVGPGGLVVADNTLLQGEPYSQERSDNGNAIAAFNSTVAADERVEQVLVPLRDGVSLIRVR